MGTPARRPHRTGPCGDADLSMGVVALVGLVRPFAVIARSAKARRSNLRPMGRDCFASLAMTQTALLSLAQTRAEGMRRVDAQDGELLGEEGELLERELQVGIVRVALDVGVELGREEIALDHVALELGHVDSVGGEAPERLVERGRDIADLE